MLIDAIAGAVLLGATLAVVLGIAGRALSLQARGEEAQVAAMLLDERLNLVLMVGPEEYRRSGPMRGACDEPYSAYTFEVRIEPGGDADPYFVSATVSWRSRGTVRSETVETYMAPRRGEDPDPQRRPEEPVQRVY